MAIIKQNIKAIAALALAGALLIGSAGCASPAPSATSSPAGLVDGLGSKAKNRLAYFITYYNPNSDPFWAQMYSGASDAAKLGNLTLRHVTANTDNQALIQSVTDAIAKKPALIFIPFNLGDSQTAGACAAHDAGIQVIAYNVPPAAKAERCVAAFIGQDFVATGKLVGERLLAAVPQLKRGDKVFLPAEHSEQPYAIARSAGVNQALAKVGIVGVQLSVGDDDNSAVASMTKWLLANNDVKAIAPLGGIPNRNIVAAEVNSGVKVPVVGFDTSSRIIQGIKDGDIIATADQQGYVQGFQAVMQGVLYIDFGLTPANINSGGNGLIDKTNISQFDDPTLKKIRY